MHSIFKLFSILTFSLFFLPLNILGGPVIYIIRHAEVDTESPGWSSSKKANIFREKYNKADIRDFDPEKILKKIDNPEGADTVFCSPQQRAVKTALTLFDNDIFLNINDNLMELQYPVIKWPVLRMPARAWLTTSLILWMAGNNNDSIPTYRERKQNLDIYSEELIGYAERNGKCIVVAHGLVNRELIRILKKKGWKYDHKEGYGNLSVNSLKR